MEEFDRRPRPADYDDACLDPTARASGDALLEKVIAVQQEIATVELDLDTVMNLVAERARSLTNASGAVVEMVEGSELVYRAAAGSAAPSLGMRLEAATSFSGLCVRTGEVLRCDDSECDERVNREACRRVGLRSMIVVPLYHRLEVAGVLKVLSSSPSAFGDRDTQILQLMSGLIAATLDRAAALSSERALVAARTRALAETEERFRLLVEGVKDYAVVMLDPGGHVVSWNPGAERITGYREDEIVGEHVSRFYRDEDRRSRKPGSALEAAAREGRFEEEGVRLHKSGSTFRADAIVTALRDSEGRLRGFAEVVRDVTERKSLEERYRHAQRMEAIGRLAGGVAHDFNNLLTVIAGYTNFVLQRLGPSDANRTDLEQVREAGERATRLTRQLLAFSRQTVLEPKVVDLNDAVRDIERMLGRLIGEDIALAARLDPNASRVRVDPGQLEQVIMNLAVNARDAMPNGGRLTIEIRDDELSEDFCRTVDAAPGRYVLLSVTDTGCGMTEDVRKRVFEPFFTTKETGKGTGLGLATVYGIVKQSEGYVSVSSEPGVGTSFDIYLPAVAPAGPSEAPPFGEPVARRGSETVLLAEDERSIRTFARLALESAGYTVLEAGSGREALALAERSDRPVDLLVTDVVMPEMSGRELAEALARRRPSTKVLYLSGYTDDAVVRHGVLHARVAFLQKPFSAAALTRTAREILDSGPASG